LQSISKQTITAAIAIAIGKMGSSISTTNKIMEISTLKKEGINQEGAKFLVLPIYYTKVPITKKEFDAAVTVWKMISSNKAPNYLAQKLQNPNFNYILCSEFFYDIFFERLQDVHPGSRSLFSKSTARMRQ